MTTALIQQVVDYMRVRLSWHTLDKTTLDAVFQGPARRAVGVYMLGRRLAGNVPDPSAIPVIACDATEATGSWIRTVYIGQSQNTIVSRLRKHSEFVQDRVHLRHTDVVFKAAEIVIFNSVDVESHLISMFGSRWDGADEISGWNGSGFGSNDTGSNRDAQDVSKFDRRFPIDIFRAHPDVFATQGQESEATVKDAIIRLASAMPYTVRIQRPLLSDLRLGVPMHIPTRTDTAYDACRVILSVLGAPWVATVSPVRIVFHKGPANGIPVTPVSWPPASVDNTNGIIEP